MFLFGEWLCSFRQLPQNLSLQTSNVSFQTYPGLYLYIFPEETDKIHTTSERKTAIFASEKQIA